MKEDENIETMFARFYTLVSGLQVMKKSYTVTDHVKKILRSLPAKWRPKVTAFQEARDLDEVTLENLISSLRSHELELMADESTKKLKGIALSSKSSSKALKAKAIEDDEEMVLMARRVSQWAKRSKKFSSKFGGPSKSSGFKDKKEDQNKCFKCNKIGHFIADCPENKNRSNKKASSRENYKNRVKKSLLATWEDLDNDSEAEEEEANLALTAIASEESKSDSEPEADSESESDEDQEVYSDLSKSELVDSLNKVMEHYTSKVRQLKTLKEVYNSLNESANKLYEENESLRTRLNFLEQKCAPAEQVDNE
jgi:hypothetical protein